MMTVKFKTAWKRLIRLLKDHSGHQVRTSLATFQGKQS